MTSGSDVPFPSRCVTWVFVLTIVKKWFPKLLPDCRRNVSFQAGISDNLTLVATLLTNTPFADYGAGLTGVKAGDLKPSSIFWTRDDGQMCVQHFSPDANISFQPHTYSEYTIVVCLDGEIFKSQLGQDQAIGRGGAIIGNHGIEHTSGYLSRHGKRCEAVVLSVERRLLATLTKEFNLPAVNDDTTPLFTGELENGVLHECARTIANELRGGLPGHKVVVETMATRLMVETLRAWPKQNIHQVKADLSPRLPRRDFVRAHEFMRWCRKENFRLQNLCQFLGSSEERFARLFLASTQHTPANFYNRMLLARACELLREPKLSVKEIGFTLGFKTSSHFIAAFRREFNTTPQECREGDNLNSLTLRFG